MRIEDGTEPMKIPLLGLKPLIGVVHLPPTTSSPRGYGNIDRMVDYVVNEVGKLEEAGFDAVIIENYGDKPFSVDTYDEVLAAVFSVVVREAVKSTRLPVGVNILRNNARLALAIAYATGAKFIRINAYCETRLSPEGILTPLARDIDQIRKHLDRNILVFADIDVKHSYPVGQYDIGAVLNDCVERGYMDAIIASGQATSKPPEPGYVAFIKRNSPKPVLLGSGLRVDNIRLYWNVVDGFIVGSSIKYGGKASNSIDPKKARELALIVNELRRKTLDA